MKITSFLILAILLVGLTPRAHAADLYANAVVAQSYNVLTPTNSVGAPDSMYADFMTDETYVKLDMGEGEEGRDGLIVYMSLLDYGATAVVTYYGADGAVLGTDNTLFSPGQTEWVADYWGTEPYRFVLIESIETERWRLDSIQASAINTPSQ